MTSEPIKPTFGHGCVTELMPMLVGVDDGGSLPARFDAGPRVLLVLDGLGWDQLQRHASELPTISSFEGGPITTVAPSTTAAALTSITTALPPGEHGIVGYRMVVDDAVFNCLRWGSKERPDSRATVPPKAVQPYDPFLGSPMPMVTKTEFRRSGFTEAHLRGGVLSGYRTPSVLVHEVARLIRHGEPSVYAYYDGVDKVAHEYGIGSEYRAELAFADRMVADLVAALPSGTTLMVTADHGQLDCGDRLLPIDPDVVSMTELLSGEARFRWLHAAGGVDELLAAAEEAHGRQAWIFSRDELFDDGWFGRSISSDVAGRLGDVAMLPFEPIGFDDPDDTGPMDLIGRHGSATSEEMLVPCVAATV